MSTVNQEEQMGTTKGVCLLLTPELLSVLDTARGRISRSVYVERQLWQSAANKKVAATLGIVKPQRTSRRGGDRKSESYKQSQKE